MTFLHLHDQGLPIHALGERRVDHATAAKVSDALRAHGPGAAAQAMQHQQVDMIVALRVLAAAGKRRLEHAAHPGQAPGRPATQEDFAFVVAA